MPAGYIDSWPPELAAAGPRAPISHWLSATLIGICRLHSSSSSSPPCNRSRSSSLTAVFEFHDPLQAAYFEPVAMTPFAFLNVKIANMIRMVQTGKLKLWRHSKPKTGFALMRYRPLPIRRIGKFRIWKGARPVVAAVNDNMRFVRVRNDNLPPSIVRNPASSRVQNGTIQSAV